MPSAKLWAISASTPLFFGRKIWELRGLGTTGQDLLRARRCPKNQPAKELDISAAEKAWNDLVKKLQDLALTRPSAWFAGRHALGNMVHIQGWLALAFTALSYCSNSYSTICNLFKVIELTQVGQTLLTPIPQKVLRLADVLRDHSDDAPDFGIATAEVWPQSWVGG